MPDSTVLLWASEGSTASIFSLLCDAEAVPPNPVHGVAPEPGRLLQMRGEGAHGPVLCLQVVPMLPRLLCEELCSLHPMTDKLTFSVIWTLTPEGKVTAYACDRFVWRVPANHPPRAWCPVESHSGGGRALRGRSPQTRTEKSPLAQKSCPFV